MAIASQMGGSKEIAGLMAKSNELKTRILFVLFAFIIFRLGTHIPVPGVDALALNIAQHQNQNGLMGMLNMFSGGAISRMALFSLGIMPYISSSIIMQLMGFAFPTIAELKKEGELGRRKINQYTRYLTVLIAFGQGMAISSSWLGSSVTLGGEVVNLVINPHFTFQLQSALMLTTGTVFLMWLGEQITSKGIGQGASLLIFAGIVAELPGAVYQTIEQMRVGALAGYLGLSVIVLAVITMFVAVFVELSQRRVLVQYPKRNQQQIGQNNMSYMPFKVNMAGVMPAIFGSTVLIIPSQLIAANPDAPWAQMLGLYLAPGTLGYMALYALLIFGFCFMWVAMQYNPEELAENLKKSNGFIPGVRPGKGTVKYFDYILMRLTPVGAVYMVGICTLPQIIINQFNVPASAAYLMGGTSLLIVVNVTIDLVTRIQTHLIAQKYDSMLKKSKFRRKTKGA